MYALEERHVEGEELGEVDVADGPEHEDGLQLLRVLPLQVAGSHQHREHRAHPVVVVLLRGELLAAELVGGHDLLGQGAGILV